MKALIKTAKKFLSDKQGVAAIEMAIVAPVLIVLLLGVSDYAFYLNMTMRLENTARAAAEYIIEGGDTDNIATDIIIPSNLGVTADNINTILTVETGYTCRCNDGSEDVCDDISTFSCADSSTYIRRFIDVRLSGLHSDLLPYSFLTTSRTLAGQVRLQTQ